MAIDGQAFRGALGSFASGVTVVTARDEQGGRDLGMTASAFCSLSLDPPLVLVCVQNGKDVHRVMSAAGGFGISMLGSDQVDLSNRFAGWGFPKDQDKFADLSLSRGAASGAALLGGALCHLDCTLWGTRDGGDHTIFIGEVQHAEVFGDPDTLQPLLYFAGRYRELGSAN